MENNKPRCRHLRTKPVVIPDFSDPGSLNPDDSTTQHYWCLCTMTTAGPDHDWVAPEKCRPERPCFGQSDLG